MTSQTFASILALTLIATGELKSMRIAIDFGSRGKFGTYICGHKDGHSVIVDSTSITWVRIGQDDNNPEWRVKSIGLSASDNFIISNGNYYGNGAEVTVDKIIANEGIGKTNVRLCAHVNAKCSLGYTLAHRMCGDKKNKAYTDWMNAHGQVRPTDAEWAAVLPWISQCYCNSQLCGWKWADQIAK